MTPTQNAIIFVCQMGRLEIESLLLASSIKRFTHVDTELIAAVPQPVETFGEPASTTLDALSCLGVKIVPFENRVTNLNGQREIQHYLANKIFALQIETDAENVALIDTDHFCKAPINWSGAEPPLREQGVVAHAAGPVGRRTAEGHWQKIFQITGLHGPHPVPEDRPANPAAESQVHPTPAYLNSGFLLLRNEIRAQLTIEWENAFRALDRHLESAANRYYVEQYALTCAIEKLRLKWSDAGQLGFGRSLWHYFQPANLFQTLQNDPWLFEFVQSNFIFQRLVANDPLWKPALDNFVAGYSCDE